MPGAGHVEDTQRPLFALNSQPTLDMERGSPSVVSLSSPSASCCSSSYRTGAPWKSRAVRTSLWSGSWRGRAELPQCTLYQHGPGGGFEEGQGAPTGPARSTRGIRWCPGVERRLAAMAESAPARVRVLPARIAGAFGKAELLAGAGLLWG